MGDCSHKGKNLRETNEPCSIEFLKLVYAFKTDHASFFYYLSCNNDLQLAIMGGWCSICVYSPIPRFLILISVTEGNFLLEIESICRPVYFVQFFLVGSHIQILTDVHLKKIVQMIKNNPNIIVAFATIPLVCFLHPAIGLGLLLLSHAFHAHSTLCRYILTSLAFTSFNY